MPYIRGLTVVINPYNELIHSKFHLRLSVIWDTTFIVSQVYDVVFSQCPKPVIAAVHGGCIGGGVDMITACDIRYSTYDAYFQVKVSKQGKSEGFESCDRPIVQKRPIWVKIGDVLYRVTLKFDGWPWKTIGHLSYAVSSFVQHFIAIGEFKLELQSGNAQFGSNSTIFWAVWPWNLMDDLKKQ